MVIVYVFVCDHTEVFSLELKFETFFFSLCRTIFFKVFSNEQSATDLVVIHKEARLTEKFGFANESGRHNLKSISRLG